jgi:predicted nucleic acid-binding protein
MMVLADTSVWSLALRRKRSDASISPDASVQKLSELIMESMAVMIGPVRQELLSGISDEAVFNDLRFKLDAFEDLLITTKDYETAARFYNACRRNGVQGSHTDFLICALAHNNNLMIFTTDQDFKHYAKFLPIRLYKL